MSPWKEIKDRAAGKWQVPLLVVSLVMLGGSLLHLRSAPTRLPPDELIKHLGALVSAGFFGQGIEFGEGLLSRSELTDADRAGVHLQLARARYGEAERGGLRTAQTGQDIVKHYQQALAYGGELTTSDYEYLGRACEWQGRFAKALEQFERAQQLGAKQPLDLRRHILALMLDRLATPPERVIDRLDRLMADAGDRRLDLRLWAIERKLEVLEDLEQLDEAATLLTRNHDRFYSSDLRDRFVYLEAWLLYKTGSYDQAETLLRTVRNRVEPPDEVFAMTGWLLGRVVMEDEGPQRPLEALSFFSSVVSFHAGEPYGIASRIGLAEALVMLERDGEALEAYRTAIEELESLATRRAGVPVGRRVVNRAALLASLGVLAEKQRQAGRLSEAVEYARLTVTLLDPQNVEQATLFLQQLAQLQVLLAQQLEDTATGREERDSGTVSDRPAEALSREARVLFAEAASTYLRLARINSINDRLAAQASWRAAELSARAGERERAADLFQTFARERPQHELVPRALLRIGQLRQASGQWSAAVDAYQEAYRRFPRMLDGARALVPLAQCYLAMGADYEDLAEKTLLIVLEESEVFTPQAPEFADALLLLGEALNRRGDFERAIATLEEALERYPDDPRVLRARFLLADSFLKSGLALKAETAKARFPGEVEQIRAQSLLRLSAARNVYHELIAEYELIQPEALSRLDKVYLRHARLYEADCLFEMGDYRGAVKLYEEAAGMYKNSPSALAAYVQIINGHVFLGEPDEARAALARALVLVDAIPEEVFARSVSPETRDDWKRYFEWLGKSELF